jgi:hypothetical protein
MLGLFLVLCLTIAYYHFPRTYYVATLQRLHAQSSQQHMVLIPRLIDRLLQDVFKTSREQNKKVQSDAVLPLILDKALETRRS